MAVVAWSELVRAIQAAPDDDTPRLVAADWLLARGDPRGEHVALQLELARRGADADLAARLAAIDPARWLAPLQALGAGVDGTPLALVRGFVDAATLTGRDVANAGPLLRREPITRLTLASPGDGASALAGAAPELGRLRELTLRGRYTSGHSAILRSPHLGELEVLDAGHLLEPQLAALADTVVHPRALHISPRAAVARALAGSRVFDRLEELYCDNLSDDAPLVEIARAPLAQLRLLEVRGWNVGPRGLVALGPRLAQLEVLRHQGRLLDRDTLALIVRHARNLRELDLPYAAAGVDDALDSGALDHLAKLGLAGAAYTRTTLLRFLMRSHMRRTSAHAVRDLAVLTNDQLSEVFPDLALTPAET